jgi:hypothetical protein
VTGRFEPGPLHLKVVQTIAAPSSAKTATPTVWSRLLGSLRGGWCSRGIAGRAFGHYVYEKRLEDSVTTVPCQVDVFPLLVKRQSKDWPESKQRTTRWFPAAKAAALGDNNQLNDLIQEFEMRKASIHRK